MNYRGTIAYRSNLHGQVNEGFLHSTVLALDFLNREHGRFEDGHNETVIDYNERFHFMRGLSVTPSESANAIAETFLGDWVLMLDTDHVFGADVFYEMVTTFEDNKLDVLCGFTQRRVYPYHPVIFKTEFDAMKDFETIFPNPIERQTLIPIDSSGCACLMVRRSVFDAIRAVGERPFDPRRKFNAFHLKRKNLGEPALLNEWRCALPEGRWIDETFAEDTSFFWRAKMLGIQAYCAPWIKFHHLSTVLVDESMMVRK